MVGHRITPDCRKGAAARAWSRAAPHALSKIGVIYASGTSAIQNVR